MAARGRRNRRSEFTQRLDVAKVCIVCVRGATVAFYVDNLQQEADDLKEELERNREETEKELDEVWNEIGQTGKAKYGLG
jgi:hypothetical protein